MSNAITITNHCLKLMILQADLQLAECSFAIGNSIAFSLESHSTALLRALMGDFGAWMLLWLSFPLALCQFLLTHLP